MWSGQVGGACVVVSAAANDVRLRLPGSRERQQAAPSLAVVVAAASTSAAWLVCECATALLLLLLPPPARCRTHHAERLQAALEVALDGVGQLRRVVRHALAVKADGADLWVTQSRQRARAA